MWKNDFLWQKSSLWVTLLTYTLSQVRFHLTFMNIRAAVCAGLVAVNGYIMSRNKRAILCREEPTWGEKSTPWATERAGLWLPIWRSRDGGNARHTLLLDTIWPQTLFTKKRLTWICFCTWLWKCDLGPLVVLKVVLKGTKTSLNWIIFIQAAKMVL